MFAAYQLQVNYRSNQEILDFANVLLQNIEANQYASIQLQANSLSTVTEQSFTDKVHFKYHQLAKISDMKDALPGIFAIDIKPYIQARLNAHEQIAFLAFTRNDVYKMQNILQGMFPQAKIVNLVPEKIYNTTVFSEFIKRYWAEVKFIPTTSITVVIAQEIVSRLSFLVHAPDKMLPIVQKMLATWRSENQVLIDSWQRQHMAGRLSLDDFLNNVKECMLQFEIRSNAVRQALVSSRNEEQKKAQNSASADMILSTIHSAKGLEFDHVVIMYRNKNELEESEKRMYYVAFTRAMKSEYILAWDTVKNPRIESDYNTIVEHLHQIHPKPAPVQTNAYAQQAQQVLAGQQAARTQTAQVQTQSDDDAFDAALQGGFTPPSATTAPTAMAVSPNTPVLTPSEWTGAGELAPGDAVTGLDGQAHVVTDCSGSIGKTAAYPAAGMPPQQAPAAVQPVPANPKSAAPDDIDDETAGFNPGNYGFTFNPAPAPAKSAENGSDET